MSEQVNKIVELENDVAMTKGGVNLFIIEILIVSIVLGVWKHSWGLGAGAFFVLITLAAIRPLAVVLAIVLTIIDASVVFAFCLGLFESDSAAAILGLAALLVTGAYHKVALQYIHPKGRQPTT